MNKHPLNRDRRYKLAALKNRRDYLEANLSRDIDLPAERYQRAELGALNWAIQTISMVYDVEYDRAVQDPQDIQEDDEEARIAAFRARIVQPSNVTQERSQA